MAEEPLHGSVIAFDPIIALLSVDVADAVKMRVIAVLNLADDTGVGLRFVSVDLSRNCSAPLTWCFATKEKYQRHWPIGTTERLVSDLAMYTGAARQDLARLNRKNVVGDVLTYGRGKTGVKAHIPMTLELRQLIGRTPEISPAFTLNQDGRPYTKESLGNFFQEAA